MSLPVQLNEPLSALQRLAAQIEYQELLIQANQLEDGPLQCLLILSAYLIGLGNTIGTTKKPFNPVLGETFQYIDQTYNTTYISEQVSHHPPISAFFADNEHFSIEGTFQMKIHLSVTGSVTAETIGDTIVTLKKSSQKFIVQRPISKVHNLVVGDTYVYFEGKSECINLQTNERAVVTLKPPSLFKERDYQLKGHSLNSKGESVYEIQGSWNKEILCRKVGQSEFLKVVSFKDRIANSRHQFNFSQLSVDLNHLSQGMVESLPSTDS